MLYVAEVGGKGRGVFTSAAIKAGERFEQVPVLVIPGTEWEYLERTLLYNYCYAWGDDMALALGMGSLYNHAYSPNARYFKHFDTAMIEYVALRDIAPAEEITITYNCDPEDKEPLWFKVVE